MQTTLRKSVVSLAALLATVGAALPMSAAAQATDFSWYGRIDMSVESNSNGSVSRTAVQNFSSRLGIKGERKFNDKLAGIFQVETGVAPDDASQSKTFASRNSFVGLKSAQAGSLIVGTHDMPLKTLEGTAYDLWGEGDLVEVLVHGKGTAAGVGSTFGNVHTRKTNVLLYTSPKFANAVIAKLAYSPDEAKKAATATVPEYAQNMLGASVEYNDGMWNAGLALQNQKNFIAPTASAGGSAMKATKITLGAKVDAWTAGLAYSILDNSAGRKTSNWVFTGTYALNADVALKGSLGRSGASASGADDAITGYALEADYALDKQFTVYGYYAALKNGANAKGAFASADNFPAVVNGGDDPRALGVGIRYNF